LFPKGYSNWHAAAMAALIGHKLVEIESDKPGVFGREPTDEVRSLIEKRGWPDSKALRASQSKDFVAVHG